MQLFLEPGDRCLVRNLGPRISSKIDDRWEKDVYVVDSRVEDLPVYTVVREDGLGPRRTLHRNLLLPVGALGIAPTVSPRLQRSPDHKTRHIIREAVDDDEEQTLPPLAVTVETSKLRPDAQSSIRQKAHQLTADPDADVPDNARVPVNEEELEQVTTEPEEPQDAEEEEDEVEKAPQLRAQPGSEGPVERYGLQYQCRTAELDQGLVERA